MLKQVKIGLTALTLTLATTSTAFAGSFENGVRNRWENRDFTYQEKTDIQIEGRTDFNIATVIIEDQYSIKVDVFGEDKSKLKVKYHNNNDKNESDVGGKVKVKAKGKGNPSFLLVEKSTHTEINANESGYDYYQGNVKSKEEGSGASGFVEASGFINY